MTRIKFQPPKTAAPASETLDEFWQRRATTNAIAAVRKAFQNNIQPGTPVAKLTDHELGWIVAEAVFSWIKSRAEEAASRGWDTEETLRVTELKPKPWDAGAVAHTLPELGALPGLDWTKPLSAWSKDEIIRFLLAATKLVATAMLARDIGGSGVSSPGSLGQGIHVAPNGIDERESNIHF